MSSPRPFIKTSSPFILLFLVILCLPFSALAEDETPAAARTIVVSAEGLADPEAETYKRDRGMMIDALRADARRQCIEKAVGTFVDSTTLVENFTVINDRVLTKSRGLIKRIIKETEPWLGSDGLMHILIKAEVYLSDIRQALEDMSKTERITLIKSYGNPTISVALLLKDAERGSVVPPERSTVAENILKEEFKAFGYRVWSEEYSRRLKGEYGEEKNRREADFSVLGEAKFKEVSVHLKASGLDISKHVLTSWSVKCINNHTGEEIYFNNKIPRNKSWNDEDAALADIGKLIGAEFSKDFFRDHLLQPSRIFQLEMTGLPDYDTALLFKKELIGLRPILNVDLRNFDAEALSTFEIEFAGSSENFTQIINNTVLQPLNSKLGSKAFKLKAQHGDALRVAFQFNQKDATLQDKLESMPPASLANAAPERIRELIKNDTTMKKVISMNPDLEKSLAGNDKTVSPTSGVVRDF